MGVPSLIDDVRGQIKTAITTGGIDVDIIHAMDERDNALIADEVLHGTMAAAFVYNFEIKGTPVQGVSVVGARHLANYYGGMRHRIVATAEKRGGLFKFTSYPGENVPMQVTASFVRELEDDPDYYTAVVEVTDIKKGNTIQIERTELRFEARRDKSLYERPNFQTIAQSKAYRNAILSLVPQDVRLKFQQECVKLGKSADLTANALEQKRSGCIGFAAKNGITVDRDALYEIGWDQLSALGESAKISVDAFKTSLASLNLLKDQPAAIEAQTGGLAPTPAKPRQTRAKPQAQETTSGQEPAQQQTAQSQEKVPPHDPETGEIIEGQGVEVTTDEDEGGFSA